MRLAWLRSGAIALVGVFATLAAPRADAQDTLRYFKNFFLTGDYVVADVSLAGRGVRGLASGQLEIPAGRIPADAEIVAAYLYWATVAPNHAPAAQVTAGASFKRNRIDGFAQLVERRANEPARCGGDWRFSSSRSMFVFRADVLRFFPRSPDATGRIVAAVNGLHDVALPDGGNGASGPSTIGAGLVVVWRQTGFDPGQGWTSPRQPLRSIVIYDGAATLNSRVPRLATTLEGFYEASRSAPNARLSMLVANGRPGSGERVRLQSTNAEGGTVTVAIDPFGAAGPRRGPKDPVFDAVTFENLPLARGAMKARVLVDSSGPKPAECLTWSAAVLSTEVQDQDFDGLLDVWESQAEWSAKPAELRSGYPQWPLSDPTGTPLPNLQAMGAQPRVQDVFVEIDYMFAAADHSHLPSRDALRWVARAFRDAAPRPSLVANGLCAEGAPRGACPINVHFDVGGEYQPPSQQACMSEWTPDCAFIPVTAGTRGGDAIPEFPCPPGEPGCAFPGFRGAVGWKNGFRAYRDEPVHPVTRQPCQNGELGCEPRFLRNRKDIFRYALFAHALALPSPSDPSRPRSSSGVADSSGADLMITLGLWDGQTGSEFVQASTLMHELGHTLGLRHGGVTPTGTLAPNCRPNYQSVMNYLFQVGGLRDPQGVPQIDFSRRALRALDEVAGLDEGAGLGAADYLPRWYAPRADSFLDASLGTTAVARRCDGTAAPAGAPTYVRVDADPRVGTSGPIDWNGDGDVVDQARIDANFDGALTPFGPGVSDFATMDLRQTGGRRAVGSESLSRDVVDPATGRPVPPGAPPIGGGLSLDTTLVDLGYGDLGYGDLGYGDLGYGDLGYGDLGYGDLGYGDLGYGDLGVPAPNEPPGTVGTAAAITYEAAVTVASAPTGTAATADPDGDVLIRWTAPTVGRVLRYEVFRVVGAELSPDNVAARQLVATLVPGAGGSPPPIEVLDTAVVGPGTFTYFVVATLADPANPGGELRGTPSNVTTVTLAAPPCTIQLGALLLRDGVAVLPNDGSDLGQNGTRLRLTSLGRLTSGDADGSVWRLRNTNRHAKPVTLVAVGVHWSKALALAPTTDTLVYSPAPLATHKLLKYGVQVDVKAANPAHFPGDTIVGDPACAAPPAH